MNDAEGAEQLRSTIFKTLWIIAAAGGVAILAYAFGTARPGSMRADVIVVAGIGFLLAGAAGTGGLLMGFLFGIPRTLQGQQQANSGTSYQINTNLEQISDWLTKIIVGVTLIQIGEIPKLLMELNEYVARRLPRGAVEEPFVGMVVVFAAVLGFLIGYLATRLYVSRAFRAADVALTSVERAVENARDVLESASVQEIVTERANNAPNEEVAQAEDPRVQRVVREVASANITAASLDPEKARQIATAHFLQEEYDKALPFFEKAGAANLHDPKLSMQYAVSLGESGYRESALALLERMQKQNKGLPEVEKLLGYFLLWIPERLKDSIRWTQLYLKSRPDDLGAVFNLACAHAQLYGRTEEEKQKEEALRYLKQATDGDERWKRRALQLAKQDFNSMRDDPRFQELVK